MRSVPVVGGEVAEVLANLNGPSMILFDDTHMYVGKTGALRIQRYAGP